MSGLLQWLTGAAPGREFTPAELLATVQEGKMYVALSGREPTMTTARPGTLPYLAFISATSSFISPRIAAAMALPSMILDASGLLFLPPIPSDVSECGGCGDHERCSREGDVASHLDRRDAPFVKRLFLGTHEQRAAEGGRYESPVREPSFPPDAPSGQPIADTWRESWSARWGRT